MAALLAHQRLCDHQVRRDALLNQPGADLRARHAALMPPEVTVPAAQCPASACERPVSSFMAKEDRGAVLSAPSTGIEPCISSPSTERGPKSWAAPGADVQLTVHPVCQLDEGLQRQRQHARVLQSAPLSAMLLAWSLQAPGSGKDEMRRSLEASDTWREMRMSPLSQPRLAAVSETALASARPAVGLLVLKGCTPTSSQAMPEKAARAAVMTVVPSLESSGELESLIRPVRNRWEVEPYVGIAHRDPSGLRRLAYIHAVLFDARKVHQRVVAT